MTRRPSLPLTERDERDLASIRESPEYRRAFEEATGEVDAASMSESAMLHALFEAGINVLRQRVQDEGYAELAHQQSEHRDAARRRRPSWADET